MIIKLIINNKTNLAMKKYQGGAVVSQIYESPSLTEHSILAEAGFASSDNGINDMSKWSQWEEVTE